MVTSVTDITEPPINFASDASPALDADDLSVNGEWDEPITVGIGTAPPAPPNVDSVEAEPTASEETALSMSDWDEPSTARLQTDWQEPSVSESFGQDSFEARADEAEEGAVKESEPQPLPAVASLDGETVGTTAAVEPPARTPLEETPSSVSSLEKPELPAAEIATTNDTVSEPHSIDRTAATEPSQDSSTAEPAQPKPPELTYRKSALGEAAALVKKAMAKKLATSRSEEAVSAVKRSDAEPTKSSSTEAAPEPGPGPSEPAENVLFTPGDEAGSSSKSPEAEATESSSTEVLPESGPGPSEPAENVLFTPGDEAGSSSKSPEAEATESSSTEVLPESGPGPSEPAENVLFSLGKEAGGAAKIDLKEQLETGTFNIKSFGMESKKQPKPFNVVNTDKIANAAKSEKVLKSLKAMPATARSVRAQQRTKLKPPPPASNLLPVRAANLRNRCTMLLPALKVRAHRDWIQMCSTRPACSKLIRLRSSIRLFRKWTGRFSSDYSTIVPLKSHQRNRLPGALKSPRQQLSNRRGRWLSTSNRHRRRSHRI